MKTLLFLLVVLVYRQLSWAMNHSMRLLHLIYFFLKILPPWIIHTTKIIIKLSKYLISFSWSVFWISSIFNEWLRSRNMSCLIGHTYSLKKTERENFHLHCRQEIFFWSTSVKSSLQQPRVKIITCNQHNKLGNCLEESIFWHYWEEICLFYDK